jgi:peptidoglycan/LPS O-acetylase OafA/YrhL
MLYEIKINWKFIFLKMITKFRGDISFLRAFSVISVLLYHFKFSYFQGGFVGVDIFFVISGYLMTKIILSGFHLNKFNLLNFYKRRVVRIFPALLVMIVIFSIVIFFLLPTQFLVYLRSTFSSSLFFSNIYYYLNSGYFDQSSQYNFLLHTWSLSVEWQFYLIYPLLLLMLKKLYLTNKYRFRAFFYVLILFSFIAMLLHNNYDNSFSFYIFYTRAWEMMLGGAAFLNEKTLKKIPEKIKILIIILSFIVIVYFTCINDFKGVWPDLITIIPVLCISVIISLNYDFSIYKNKVVKYIGDLSYSLYLYHWPFYVLSLFFSLETRIRYKLLFILLSVIFSVLSFHFIEKRKYDNKVKYLLSGSLMIFCISLVLTKVDAGIYYKKIGNLINITANYKYSNESEEQYSLGAKHLLSTQKFEDYNIKYWVVKNDGLHVILLGDSHAGMFSKTVHNLLKENNINCIQATADATYPMLHSKGDFKGPIDFFNYFFTKYFPLNHEKIKLVIISANYAAYSKDELIKKINFTENYFSKYNIKVLYLGQTDIYPIDYPTYYHIKNTYKIVYNNELKNKKNLIEANNFLIDYLGNKYVDLMNYKIKKISPNYTPYMYDSNHLTYYGTEQYKSFIKNRILEAIN